jgi:2-oxoisovalerate dehydrogenase E2 component (dihydrolipoyl transacylase)
MSAFVFKLPDVGEGTTEAEVAAWHVTPGERVSEDQPLVDVMTDKATVEITSPVSGTVQTLHVKAGDMAAVGAALVSFDVADAAAGAGAVGGVPAEVSGAKAAVTAPPATTPAAPSNAAARSSASPSVRRHARESAVPLERVTGSGPGGRILHRDVDAWREAAAGRTSGIVADRDAVQEIQVIGLRRRIADRMVQSKRSIPHFTYVEEIDVTELESLRLHLNATDSQSRKLSPLAFFARALARVLPEYPQINATYDEQAGVLRQYRALHLGIATQTPGGLMVPVVRHVESRSLWDCAAQIARVAAAARSGKATREELSGSTLTLTSLGPLGGIAATPIINHPEVAIIGPNRILERPVVRHGQVVVRKIMNLSSAFDQRLKGLLEMPATLFIDP